LNAVLAPAINYAENGYKMLPGEALRQQIAAEKIAEFKGSSHHFLKGNSTANSAGDLIIQKDLAEVLKAIAANGRKGFYEGEVARKIVEDIQANGGIITLEDLKNYRALSSKIVDGVFKDHKVHSLYLPSFGAITVQILQILDHLPSFNSEEDWALSNGKATEIAYKYRKKQENLDSLNLILSYEKAGELADKIDSSFSNIQTNIESDNPISFGSIDGHTTHLTAVDHFGNAVS
jgi:Gamma-glutamyltransferase